jgi:beta-glucosidase
MSHIRRFVAGTCIPVVFSIVGISSAVAQTTSSQDIDQKVEALLKKMTIEEKAGQMTQLTLGPFVDNTSKAMVLKKEELRKAIVNSNVGSILNNAQDHTQSLEEWHEIINTIQNYATKESRLKIPVLYGVDAIHGATYLNNSVLFPQQLAIGCTRNTEYAAEMGRITAMATRATGIRWNFAPVLDVARSPLWSRFPESFGESTWLVQQMGLANIKAAQGKKLTDLTSVSACMKHFLGYSASNTGKDRTTASIPEPVLREVFLPPFRAAVQAGARTVMINSSDINGIPVHASKFILTKLLRDELGFTGLAVTDWEDIIKLHTRHKIAATEKEAVYLAIEAGVDMSMVPYNLSFYDQLIELVKEGRITEARLDLSVRRILKVKYELGLFENAFPEAAAKGNAYPKEAGQTSLNAARESLVLLKNLENNLPLKAGKKVLVVGPTADYMPSLCGSWSYTWQGADPAWFPKDSKTILGAVRQRAGEGNVVYKPGVNLKGATLTPNEELMAEAAKADVILLCLGEDAYAEIPGNIDDLNLPEVQKDLARTLSKSGKPVIFVLAEGRPRIFTDIEPLATSVLLAIQPGLKGGEAIAEVLFGDVNPSGKLSFTYPKFPNDLLTHDCQIPEVMPESNDLTKPQYKPMYPFGFGLSYTRFAMSPVKINKPELKGKSDSLVVTFDLTNTGNREGKEAIDLFTRDHFASMIPAYRKHRKFTKLFLKPGETKPVRFVLYAKDLEMVNADNKSVTESGEFSIYVQDQEVKFKYSE